MLEIANLPMWYIVLLLIPLVQLYPIFKISIAVAHRFGKSTGFGVGMVFLPYIFPLILAFGKNNTVMETNGPAINNNQFQTPVNNVENNNFETQQETPAGIAMFNQNINTEINSVNSPMQNIVSNEPVIQNNIPTPFENTVQQPTMETNNVASQAFVYNQPVEEQPPLTPENNTVNYNEMPMQNIVSNEPVIPNNIPTPFENAVQQPTMETNNVAPQAFAYTQPVVEQQQIVQPIIEPTPLQVVPTPAEQNIIQNSQPVNNIQAANTEQPLNVIPGMGTTPMPTQQMPNMYNNPNNTQM
jgi:hypothetical protein